MNTTLPCKNCNELPTLIGLGWPEEWQHGYILACVSCDNYARIDIPFPFFVGLFRLHNKYESKVYDKWNKLNK